MDNKICVSLRSQRLENLGNLMSRAKDYNPAFIEVRLDYLETISPEEVRKVLSADLERCILTCRSMRQGGFFKGDEETRLRLLEEIIGLHPGYIDVELEVLRENMYLAGEARESDVKVIASWHDFQGTPGLQQLKALCREALEHGDLAKVVAMARSFKDNATILSLYKTSSEGRLIAFCMGEVGITSRVLCTWLGAPFTYVSLDETTAPGQVSIEELRRFYNAVQTK
ncbi:MAG: type I 3-dehydroquinate dehydratase [Candidatus Bathyarchaeia archaeon]